MAEDDTIRALNRRVEELTAENATLKSESKDRRIKGNAVRAELEALKKDHDQLIKDRDGWKVKADASHPELVKQVEELKGVIRTARHRAVFQAKAEAAGVDQHAIGDLWTLSGYHADAEEPDASAIDAAIAEARTARPYLFGRPAPGEASAAAPARLRVDIEANRGAGKLGADAFHVSQDNLHDVNWMARNAAKMQEHRAAGTLVFE